MNLNFYEVLGLSCKVKLTEADILTAVDKLLANCRKQLNNNSALPGDRARAQQIIDAEADMRAFSKSSKLQQQHKKELQAKREKLLGSLITLMGRLGGSRDIMRPRINALANHLDLETGTVINAFTKAGYTVITSPASSAAFTPQADLDRISGSLAQLRSLLTQQQKNGNSELIPASIAGVQNIYEYLASTHSQMTAEEYMTQEPVRLKAWCEDQARLHTQNTNPYPFFKELEALAASKLFDTQAHKDAYDNTLKLNALAGDFAIVRELPPSLKGDRSFAESIIRSIQKIFPDEATAILLYNVQCSVPRDLWYEKESTTVYTSCICGQINEHEAMAQAQHASCRCGRRLYIPCPNCGALLGNAQRSCSCGYQTVWHTRFTNAVQQCHTALSQNDLAAAQQALATAQQTKPKRENIDALAQNVLALQASLGKSLSEVSTLIAAQRFDDARRTMAQIRAAYPGVDLTKQEKALSTAETHKQKALNAAAKEFRTIESLRYPADKIRKCMQILELAPDYKPALDLLSSAEYRPVPVASVCVSVDPAARAAAISWTPNPSNAFVTYTVVRRENAAARSIAEGVVIVSGKEGSSVRDASLQPGVHYFYTVFCVRGSLCCNGATHATAVMCCPPLPRENIQYEFKGNHCIFRWKNLPGSRGLRFCRVAQNDRVAVDCCGSTFEDDSLAFNATYRYQIYTLWLSGSKFVPSGIPTEVDVQLVRRPAPAALRLYGVSTDGQCTLQWTADQGEIIIASLPRNSALKENEAYSEDMLSSGMLDKRLWTGDMRIGQCTVKLPPASEVRLIVLRRFGTQYITGPALEVSTLPQLPVNWSECRLANNQLEILLHDLPPTLSEVHCFWDVAREDAARPAPAEIRRRVQNRSAQIIRPVVGQDSFTLTLNDLPHKQLVITVTGVTKAGAIFRASVHAISNIPRHRISYSVEWDRKPLLAIGNDARGMTLNIHSSSGRIPQLYLCCRRDGRAILPNAPYDPNAMQIIKKIPACNVSHCSPHLTFSSKQPLHNGVHVGLLIAPEEPERAAYDPPHCAHPFTLKASC